MKILKHKDIVKDLGMIFASEKAKKKKHFYIVKCVECSDVFRKRDDDIMHRKDILCASCTQKLTPNIIKHGMRYTRIYKIWIDMRQRCSNEKKSDYHYYGGRGIVVCNEWNDFVVFNEWAIKNGYSDTLTIDRKDNDGNYEPFNCRWVARNIQARNTKLLRSSNTSGYRGVSLLRGEWIANICVDSKYKRVGKSLDKKECAIMYDKYVYDNKLEHTTNGLYP